MSQVSADQIKQYLKPEFGRDQLVATLIIVSLVCSAVAVSYSVHKYRGYLNELQRLQAQRDDLETQWGQLLLEQQAWGAYGRVGKIATEEWQMRTPAPQEVIMVRP